ncbi:hypothetical protein [Borrelia persica]|nr:hypothetical protein [Borrelia persica]
MGCNNELLEEEKSKNKINFTVFGGIGKYFKTSAGDYARDRG